MPEHLLNLRALADAQIDAYALLGFEGREAISEPFDYRLELITDARDDLTGWIGKLAEFDITPHSGVARIFAGRIYGARRVFSGGLSRVFVQVRPAYHALSYGRATHFMQDVDALAIFDAMTADVPGLVTSVSVAKTPPVRGYAVRYDESDIDFLARLLAQDGIMYFFAYDRAAGPYRHRMVLTDKAAEYVDLAGGAVPFLANAAGNVFDELGRNYRAAARSSSAGAFNPNKLDQPFAATASSIDSWGATYSHADEAIGFEALAAADNTSRAGVRGQALAQAADQVEGRANDPGFAAGVRVEIEGGDGVSPRRVVVTSVVHSARDPWMLQGSEPGHYANQFTAIDATRAFRPPVGAPERKAPGPLLGTVGDGNAKAGETKVDEQWRVPVLIAGARSYASTLPDHVWLPVQQQWAHSTHGAQFFPRVGTRVIVDFLYGNPDLPFITGTVYTPSQPYPFDPAKTATQSGWRSVTDGNGSIVQEFRFEDKPGAEEVYLYTGRDYRRLIDQDDFGTVKRDQTLAVERDQSLTVTRDRTVKIDGKQKTDIQQTRTVTVMQKSLLESKQEIQFKVGPSTITMTNTGIVIKAPKIEVKADVTLDASAGAMATLKAPKTDVLADAMLTLKGGIVLIN